MLKLLCNRGAIRETEWLAARVCGVMASRYYYEGVLSIIEMNRLWYSAIQSSSLMLLTRHQWYAQ